MMGPDCNRAVRGTVIYITLYETDAVQTDITLAKVWYHVTTHRPLLLQRNGSIFGEGGVDTPPAPHQVPC